MFLGNVLLLIVSILGVLHGVHAQNTTFPLILSGSGIVVGENIRHPSGNIFNQVLLTGQSITLQAKPGQITRASFMDHNLDIVQVEFSGAGTFTINLDPTTFIPARFPPLYNQQVRYVTGTASIVIEGAYTSTYLSVFTVGKINAVNQALFPSGQYYDAQADVTLVEVINSTGMGGMQLSNTVFSGYTGKIGIDARGVPIAVRLVVGDIDARGDAVPHLLFGRESFTVPASNSGLRIAGGDLQQSNKVYIIAVSEAANLIFQANVKSDGTQLMIQKMRGSFNFIDQPILNFAPQSLNDRGYDYQFEEGNFMLVSFSGHTSGFFVCVIGSHIKGSAVVLSITGRFNSEIDFIDANKIHVTMVAEKVKAFQDSVDNLVYDDTIEELAFESGLPVLKLFNFEMNFQTYTSGMYLVTLKDTDGFIESSRGTFEQVR